MIAAFIAALLNPIEIIGTKEIFKKERVNYKSFLVLNVFFIFIVCAVAFLFGGDVSKDFFQPVYIIALAGIVTIAYFANRLFYYALSGDNVCNVEPISMLSPVVAVILAALIYPDERNWQILVIAMIAGLALAISRIEKHHFKVSKYTLAMLFSIFLFAIDSIIAKYLLEVLSPIAFYTLRIGLLSLLFIITIRPNLKVFGKKRTTSIFLISVLTAVEVLAYYFAIDSIGIVKTSLIFLLGPVLVLFSSRFYLKEKIKLKAAIADFIILLCVAASIFI